MFIISSPIHEKYLKILVSKYFQKYLYLDPSTFQKYPKSVYLDPSTFESTCTWIQVQLNVLDTSLSTASLDNDKQIS